MVVDLDAARPCPDPIGRSGTSRFSSGSTVVRADWYFGETARETPRTLGRGGGPGPWPETLHHARVDRATEDRLGSSWSPSNDPDGSH